MIDFTNKEQVVKLYFIIDNLLESINKIEDINCMVDDNSEFTIRNSRTEIECNLADIKEALCNMVGKELKNRDKLISEVKKCLNLIS